MNLEIRQKGRYQILKIRDELRVISELNEVQAIIDRYIQQGRTHIAVSFTNASYVYSGAIAVLVNCLKKVQDRGGDLCLIEPNLNIYQTFDVLGVTRYMHVYKSEDLLPGIQER